MKAYASASHSVFVYFWLGMLTGAIVVLMAVMIQSFAKDGSASLLQSTRGLRSSVQSVQMGGQPNNPAGNITSKIMGGQPN